MDKIRNKINIDYDNLPSGFLIYRADSDKEEILFANKHLITMFGCSSYEEFIKHVNYSFKGLVAKEDLNNVQDAIKQQIKSGTDYFNHVNYHTVTKDGKVLYVENFGRYIPDSEYGPVYYAYIVNLDIKFLTYDIDFVTGLPGLKRFMDYAENTVSLLKNVKIRPDFSFIYVKINHFNNYNIRYGIETGNALLKNIVNNIKDLFPNNQISRVSESDFAIFSDYTHIGEKLDDLEKIMRSQYPFEWITFNAGAYVLSENDDTHLDLALDNAKRACQEAERDQTAVYKIYDDEMRKNRALYDYVTTHIDEAIENGWIQVYYQPVIRTINGTLCSAEALSRWIDPKYGFLPPNKFVGPLEDTRQIHKLDRYVVKEICRLLHERLASGLPVVPISFNLSKIDFILMDAYQMIIEFINEYEIPHDLIKIEITETTVMSDEEAIKSIIKKFHNSGLSIWMDDFGSGYSSLNMLKDFDFDEIKFDMEFISDFTEKSKKIIQNGVRMAKDINVLTLAEGVETEDQFDFLKSIGCERAQGYLFSRPLPYNEMLNVCLSQGIQIEKAEYRHFYDKVGNIDFASDSPLAIIQDEKKANLSVLFVNQAFEDEIKVFNIQSHYELERLLNSPSSLFSRQLRERSYLPTKINQNRVFFYTYLGNYIRFDTTCLAISEERIIYKVYVTNITSKEEQKQQSLLDNTLRDLYHLYASIDILDLKNSFIHFILRDDDTNKDGIVIERNIHEVFKNIKEKYIYISDCERFERFFDIKTLNERIISGGNGAISDAFRYKNSHNEYIWRLVTIMLVSKPDDQQYIVTSMRFNKNEQKWFNDLTSTDNLFSSKKKPNETMNSEDILVNSVQNANLYFFWKDKERRFLGASKAFLDVFGFKDVKEIVGKTDDDVDFNVTTESYRNHEWDVIEKGEIVKNFIGKCIIKGVPHTIAANKWPIYKDGKIVGLFGYFVDLEKEKKTIQDLTMVDPNSGLLNARGFMESLLNYISESKRLKEPFSMIVCHIPELNRIAKDYGKKTADSVELSVGRKLKDTYGVNCSIAHLEASTYIILRSFLGESRKDYLRQVKNTIDSIDNANGRPITLFSKVIEVSSDEARNDTEAFHHLAIQKLSKL